MAEATIITQPYKPDGSTSRACLKTTTIPEATYDNIAAQSSVKRITSQVNIFDKVPTKALKSFASSILSLRPSWSSTRSDTDDSAKNSEHVVRDLRKSESATAMEIYEKHQEDTKILKE